MDNAFVRHATTGAPLGKQPTQFVRLPCVGELFSAPPGYWTVVRVLHGWTASGPVAELHIAPAQQAHAAASADHVNPF